MVFVVNRDAMLVRRNANVSLLADGLRAVTGAVLSVFATGQRRQIQTGTAVIGIRGTAVYIEAERERTYVWHLLWRSVARAARRSAARETVRTAHHEQPRLRYGDGRAAEDHARAGAQPHRRRAHPAREPGRAPAAVHRPGRSALLGKKIFNVQGGYLPTAKSPSFS